MRGPFIMAAATLLLAAAATKVSAQGYDYSRPPPGYGPPPPPPGYGPPPPPPGYGPPPPPPGYGPPPGPPPSYGGGQLCAMENGFCNFRGYATVRYGARGRYITREARDGIPCNNRVFGDPIYGVPKRCYVE